MDGGVAELNSSTLTSAQLTLENNVDLRVKEFGSDLARCIAAGQRKITLNFELFELADTQTAGLYQAARQRSPIGVMFQLGEQSESIVRRVHAGDGAGGSGVRR